MVFSGALIFLSRIYAQPGKRIRLEFRDFYLIGPGDDGICYSQGVVIKAPLADREMGPHCGNAGLPTIISTGDCLFFIGRVKDLTRSITFFRKLPSCRFGFQYSGHG